MFCIECDHLNGIYKDTKDFVKKLYVDDEGIDYANNYIDKFYKRTKDIYLPKVDFLMSSIPSKKLNILDIGWQLAFRDGCFVKRFRYGMMVVKQWQNMK